ncbi:MAG: TolC family protein [Bacteroidia bacterium]|nr:TolC family protein [Bacteroidia bacterium]MCO5254436.1 TolC family protein [Bacteroidota bacterium]MCZ2129996.1 TolC family protein [Bacteroidia bacterium]
MHKIKNRNIVRIWGIMGLMLFLSSCLAIKKYEKPSVNTEHLFRTDYIHDNAFDGMDTGSIADISWKNMFSDELLKSYIQKALDNNLDIRIAVANIEAAESYVKQSKAGFLPSVNADLDYSITKTSSSSRFGAFTFNQFQIGASAGWEADIWGKIKSRQRAAQAVYLQSVEAHKAVKTSLIAAVANTYYQLAAISAQIKIAQRSVATRDSSVKTTQALKDAGQLTEVAVKQSESQLYDAKLILLNLQKQEKFLENTFCLLLNEAPHSIERNAIDEQHFDSKLSIGVPAKLLANRPDVLQAEYIFRQTFELTNLARSNFYPSFNITASGGLQSMELAKWLDPSSLFANLAAGFIQPIFNQRQIQTAYEVAKTQQEKAYLGYQLAILNAGIDVSNALIEYQTQTESIALNQSKFEANQIAVTMSNRLLQNGLATYLEVLTAQQNMLNAELNLVSAKLGKLNAVVNLYCSLGGGWQ